MILLSILLSSIIFSQSTYNGPDDISGDPSAVKESRMDGNRILLYFKNTTQLSNWEPPNGLDDVSIWPNDGTGYRMLDGVALLVGGKVYIEDDGNPNTVDTTVLDDKNMIETELNQQSPQLHEVYFLQTSYREEMDHDELDLVKWGFYPVFGYANSYQDYPAMSDDEDSWPTAWPSTGTMTKWPGEWDGRFGRGVKYADLETYFVVNDAQDLEYIQNKWECQNLFSPNNGTIYDEVDDCVTNCELEENCFPTEPFEYYPRPGKYIDEGSSVQPGMPWGGLGIRVEARAFQWNNPLVRDALFWEYNISNISDYNITEMAFGYWVDNSIGGEADDEVGYFDTTLDLAYSWDNDATGFGGGTPGIMGFAFLESPGISSDNIDNDQDGLINESRDNDAGVLIGPTEGCLHDDCQLFLESYDLELSDLKIHYSGDEDQDWIFPVLDDEGNCAVTNDDVGLDGVGPNDINYTGPDDGECNNRPDCVEGVGCEPNFGETDISESDMIGLTAFKLFPVDQHSEDTTTKWFKNDQIMWDSLLVSNQLDQFEGTPSNLIEVFSSAIFSLDKGRTERISMAEIHSMDDIQGSPGGQNQDVPALFALKKTVQLIYETDYRFAVPPDIPTLTAEAGDEHVILTWNDIAESSVDRFLPEDKQNDFEGYKLYRSTDKYFKDAQIITDGFGNPMFYDPIFQCDKIDSIRGFADYATVFGAAYYLGDDTGIEHKYIDYDVENGRTYYYAVVAYDYGLEPSDQIESGIPPSENKALIELDENEYVIGTGPNVAVVIPTDNSAGYVNPWLDIEDNLSGTGSIEVDIYAPELIEDNSNYILTFENSTDNENYLVTSGFNVYKEDLFCSDIDCNNFLNEDCINQYGCYWDNTENHCIEYPCNIYDDISMCNTLEACSWNDGIIQGSWQDAEIAGNFTFDIDFNGLFDSISGYNENSQLILLGKQNALNDCYKLKFELENENKYNIIEISRFGNFDCEGLEIKGYCESDDYAIYDIDSCNDSGGQWTSYVSEFNIEDFYMYNNGVCEFHLTEFCETLNFGSVYCNSLELNETCHQDAACFLNEHTLVYSENGEMSPYSFYQNHFDFYENNNPEYNYWTINPDNMISTDVIDGLVFSILNVENGSFKNSAWLQTDSYSGADDLIIVVNDRLEHVKPWDCRVVFTDNPKVYTTPQIRSNLILDENDNDIAHNAEPYDDIHYGLFEGIFGIGYVTKAISFDFYVYSETIQDTLDLIVVDMNDSNEYEKLEDKILVGYAQEEEGSLRWKGTNFSIVFDNQYPEPDDIYSISYNIPFLESDSLLIHTNSPDSISVENHDLELDGIKVVPNPYVGTNLMEEAFSNPNQSQERKIMFTHLPALCTISIFTTSGVLVDRIEVDNDYNDGKAYWDLLSNEGLEVAAGMYLYHVQSKINNKSKVGKFAIIK